MENENRITRQEFIKLSTRISLWLAGLLGLGGLARFFSLSPDYGSQTRFVLGKPDDFPPGSKTVRTDIPAVIYNRGGRMFALSLSCTHLGCTLEEDGQEFSCPCHGSRFGNNGQVLAGPADQSLSILQVELNDEGMYVLSTKGGGK